MHIVWNVYSVVCGVHMWGVCVWCVRYVVSYVCYGVCAFVLCVWYVWYDVGMCVVCVYSVMYMYVCGIYM